MATIEEAFDTWLEEKPYSMVTSRREWAHINGVSLSDLKWAFSAGWLQGRYHLLEEFKK